MLGAGSGFSSISNHGLIMATFGNAIDASALLTGGAIFVHNKGTMIGGYVGAATADILTNRGEMDLVSTGIGDDVVRNLGVMDGDVLLGIGNDSFDGRRGEVGAYVDGRQNDDLIRGGGFDNDLRGGIGTDTLIGGDGDDLLGASLGSDSLSGGAGADKLTGGADQDTMTGGGVFVFASAADIGTGAARDKISDFNNGNDTIDLSAFMACGRFIGAAPFSATAVGEVQCSVATGILSGDVDGNGTVEWQIALQNRPALTAPDFIF